MNFYHRIRFFFLHLFSVQKYEHVIVLYEIHSNMCKKFFNCIFIHMAHVLKCHIAFVHCGSYIVYCSLYSFFNVIMASVFWWLIRVNKMLIVITKISHTKLLLFACVCCKLGAQRPIQ